MTDAADGQQHQLRVGANKLRSKASHRARIIAANNILNALFMIVSALGVGALLAANFTIPQVFLIVGILNAIVAFYIFMLVPEYFLRFVAFLLTRFAYRFKVRGGENIPAEGAAILVCNHVAFVDPVLLMAASPRPIRFIMDHQIFAIPVLGWFFRLLKAIPIASQRDDPEAYEKAFAAARTTLDEGELLCIFPEGVLTRNGQLGEFKGGVMKLLGNNPVPVVPLALQNLWGSYFSRIEGSAMKRPFRRGLFNPVGLVARSAMQPAEVTPAALQDRVADLLAT